MKQIVWLLLAIIGLMFLSIVYWSSAYYSDAQNTVFNQTKASAVLKKYEWFKSAAAQISALDASIKIQQKTVTFLESERATWTRDDKQNWHQATVELAGIKAGYNNLVAEYNAAMASANWKFCNIGDLPAGATEVMRKEYAIYKDE